MAGQDAPCHKKSVSRWLDTFDPDAVDPGPYSVGESVDCPACGATVTVTRELTNQREAGTQYVAHIEPH